MEITTEITEFSLIVFLPALRHSGILLSAFISRAFCLILIIYMDKIIALPMENGRLCEHFGHCEYFAIVKVENSKVVDIQELTPPEHVPGLYPRWVAEFGVTDVIAGGMGQKAIELFNQQKINAFVGAPVKSVSEIVDDFINNRLALTANYCNHDHGHEHGNCRH